MTRENWYWDLNMPLKKIRQILAREDDPRFPRLAGTLLSRVQDSKQVFDLITPNAFCRRYQAIENEIKSDEWAKEKAAFWKATYLRLSRELQEKGEKIRKPEIIELDAFDRALVEKVKQCRKAAAMSQKELAQFMDYSQQFISGIETGREKITVDFVKKVVELTQQGLQSPIWWNRCPQSDCGEALNAESVKNFEYLQEGNKHYWKCSKGHKHEAGNKGAFEYRFPYPFGKISSS